MGERHILKFTAMRAPGKVSACDGRRVLPALLTTAVVVLVLAGDSHTSSYQHLKQSATLTRAAAASYAPTHWYVAGLNAALATRVPQHPPLPEKSHTVTVVTSYFQLQKSKHSHDKYQKWIRNFMLSISSPMVMFTDDANEPALRKLRGTLPSTFVAYTSLWDVPMAAHYRTLYKLQHSIDPEQDIHRPELYAVWNCKPWFVATAALHNPFNSTYFMWVDAGSFRERPFLNWPSAPKLADTMARCQHASCLLLGKISDAGQAWSVNPRKKTQFNEVMIEGGFFAGSRHAVLWWLEEFMDLLHDHSTRGIFVGKDQELYNLLVVQNFWRVLWFSSHKMSKLMPMECGGDPWFAFQYALSDDPSAPGCTIITDMYEGTINVHLSAARHPEG